MLLRSVLRAKPELRLCLCRCRHCGIFFIADPRNAKRRDLGCPFGCQEAHRKCESNRRSVEYYRSPKGRERKRQQNRKRYLVAWREPESCLTKQEREPEEPATENLPAEVAQAPNRWAEPLVEHVRVVSSLIEGRQVSRDEVLEMLGEIWRQRRMVQVRKVDHIVAQLHQEPP